jgi:hypothetical protein
LTFERRALSVPSLFKSIKLFLFFSGGQTHLFALLLVHEFANGSLGLLIEVLQRFGVIYFGCVDLWITLEDSTPDSFFGFL